MRARTLLALIKWKFRDYVLFKHKYLISTNMCFFVIIFFFLGRNHTAITLLMKADRFSETRLSRLLIKRYLDRIIKFSVSEVISEKSVDKFWVGRTIVLKDPVYKDSDVVEKGVYLIKFTSTFGDVFRSLDLTELEKCYNIVLEPSWAGYCIPEILAWATLNENVIVQSSEVGDRNLLELINTNLKAVSFGSSDWVDPEMFFEMENEEKIYDVICVANFNSIKRPYVLVEVLSKLKSRGIDLKAALVCASWGDSKSATIDFIQSYDLGGSLEIFESVGQKKINLLLNRSKVNLLLSLKEGSNRCIFEGLFAGTPGIVLRENIGVNKSYLNSKTGACVKEEDLPETLVHFSKNWANYQTRLWAMENISPSKTVKKLAKAIVDYDPSQKVDFAIAEKVNSPEANLVKGGVVPLISAQEILERYKK